jgi:two-component system, sensor histidine kinase and response regulator
VTAHAMKGDRERCLQAGMDGYVSKPISPQTLFQTISEVLLALDQKTSVLCSGPPETRNMARSAS